MSIGGRKVLARSIALVLALMTPLALVMPAKADAISDKQNQRQQIGNQISSLQQQIAATRQQEDNLQAQISTLGDQIVQTEAVIAAAQAKLAQITQALEQEQSVLAATMAKLESDKHELATATKLIYEASIESTPLNNIAAAHSFNDFWENLLDTRRIADQMQTLVEKVQAEKQQVEQMVAQIAAQQAQQQQVVGQLDQQKAALNSQKAALSYAQYQLSVVVSQDLTRLAQAEAAAKELDNEIAALIAAQQAAARQGGGSGRFSWPMHGFISQYYGCTTYWFEPYDPNCSTKHFHTGIDIANSCGTPIHAADAGIAYTYWSDWGYGDHIIIVHGNGWATVYGHMGGFAVGNGQAVGRGQYIGNEGSTGNSTGCHLHFEVRSGGGTVNPLNYLP